MGILDEAIRDHLELKRQHGAESDELQRLEDEAFGPPTRPGEPDFPGSGEANATNGGLEPATAEEDAADVEPGEVVAAGAESESVALDETPAPAEAVEHSIVADPSEAETTLYDHALDEDLGLADLGVAPEEESAAPEEAPVPPTDVDAEPAEEPPAEAAAAEVAPAQEPPAEEPPIESLETVEHPIEPASDELEALPEPDDVEEPPSDELAEEPPSDEYAPEPPTDGDPPAAEAEPESSEEDVLADTPDFLRDAPEDDELWFEQGKPKDFDFD